MLCAIAFALGKLRVVLKIADQSRASSHFNSQNTHSQFRNSHITRDLASIYSHCSKKITFTWVSEFTATSQFCIFSHFSVKLRENGWLNFQLQKILFYYDNVPEAKQARQANHT